MASSPLLARRTLGSELRRLREAAKIPVRRASEYLDCSPSKISRIETGINAPRRPEIEALLRLYGDAAVRMQDELFELAADGKQSAWYDRYGNLVEPGSPLYKYLGLEEGATQIRTYSPSGIPGLLQTDAYGRAMLTATSPGTSADDLDVLVRLRADRKKVFRRKDPLKLAALVDEAVVRRPAPGAGVMREQILHLRSIVEAERSDQELRLVPFTAGLHGVLGGPFTLLSFDGAEDDILFFEGQAGGVFQDSPDVINSHLERLEAVWKVSLAGPELVKFLQEVADTHP